MVTLGDHDCQSDKWPSVNFFCGAGCSLPTVRDIQHTRRHNLQFLLQECEAEIGRSHGSVRLLANRSGVKPSFLSMILSGAVHSTTGKQRQIGDDTASKLEAGMGKDPGWLDVDRSQARDFKEAQHLDRLRALNPQQRESLEVLLDAMLSRTGVAASSTTAAPVALDQAPPKADSGDTRVNT